MNREQVQISGISVDNINFEDALDRAYNCGGQIVTINPEMISIAKKNPEFADVISNSELIIPDGVGVELGLKILGYSVKRIAGIEFGKSLIELFSKNNKKIAFIGAKPGVAEKAIENLKSEIQNLNIVYCHDGYFQDDDVIISQIVSASPDLVLVALGAPKQEFFISKLKSLLPSSTMIGLGGSFDVWAGEVKRAPAIYQKMGLEWLYRVLKEPKRFKRIFPTLPVFVLNVLKERLTK